MTRVFPDFNELVASLAKRGVTVTVKGRYSHGKERMSYTAEVATDKYSSDLHTWPHVQFVVYGRELNELADDIVARLPLVEPIIAAHEKRREHAKAIEKAERVGAELAGICIPSLEPNDDPKTAKEQPLKLGVDGKPKVMTPIRFNVGFDRDGFSDAVAEAIVDALDKAVKIKEAA